MVKGVMLTTVLATMSLSLSMNIATEYKIQMRSSELSTEIVAKQLILNFVQSNKSVNMIKGVTDILSFAFTYLCKREKQGVKKQTNKQNLSSISISSSH